MKLRFGLLYKFICSKYKWTEIFEITFWIVIRLFLPKKSLESLMHDKRLFSIDPWLLSESAVEFWLMMLRLPVILTLSLVPSIIYKWSSSLYLIGKLKSNIVNFVVKSEVGISILMFITCIESLYTFSNTHHTLVYRHPKWKLAQTQGALLLENVWLCHNFILSYLAKHNSLFSSPFRFAIRSKWFK